MAALTNRQIERFCQEYVIDYNGAQAATRAGYSERRAASQASVLLKREDVIGRITELQKEQARRLGLTADRVVLEAWEVFQRCMQASPVMVWDFDEHAYVEDPDGTYKFDANGAMKALKLIGDHLGMFRQTVEVSGKAEDMARLGELIGQLGMSRR